MTDRPPSRLSPLTPLVRSFIVLLAAATTVVRDLTRGDLGPTATVFVLLLVGGAIYGTAAWVRTKFWIEADELRVDTGVVSRQSRRIRIDRLQGVDIVQPLVARLLGLAELRMDVAGGSAREGSLAYLPLADARRLKDLLLTRRAELRAEPGTVRAEPGTVRADPGTGPSAGAPAAEQVPRDVPVARVDLGRLLLSVLLSGETVWLVLVSAGVLAAFGVTGDGAAFSAMLPVILGFGIALWRKAAGNYGFAVTQTPAGLQVRKGLFELSSQTIALPRVQGVVVTEPLLWRRLGWARLDVSIAGYATGAENEGSAPSVVLPVGDRDVVLALARHVLSGRDPEQVALRPAPRRARWRAPLVHRNLRVGTSEDLVVSREGWFARRTHVAPQARVQSLRITQGPWQRALGLADVHADSPPGVTTVRARHRDAAEARRLFEVEAAMTAWARRNRP